MQRSRKNFGGAAIEYLVVSLVTLGMSFAAVKIVKESIKSRLEALSDTMELFPESDGTSLESLFD